MRWPAAAILYTISGNANAFSPMMKKVALMRADCGVDPQRRIFLLKLFLVGRADRLDLSFGRGVGLVQNQHHMGGFAITWPSLSDTVRLLRDRAAIIKLASPPTRETATTPEPRRRGALRGRAEIHLDLLHRRRRRSANLGAGCGSRSHVNGGRQRGRCDDGRAPSLIAFGLFGSLLLHCPGHVIVSVNRKSCAVLPGASVTLQVPEPVMSLYLPLPPMSAIVPLSGPS